MDYDRFISDGWDSHAADPAALAQRLASDGLALAQAATDLQPLARLAHHVHGEHLARWADGIAFQQQVAALPSADAAALAAVRRFVASLSLAGNQADLRGTLAPADATWATVLAATSLGPHDALRAGALLREALSRFDAAGLPATAPCTRAMAICGNNLASTLEERAVRSEAERALMILAAQTGRRFWARAGGWMEVERAEYRLAQTWLKAGDAAMARTHAEACLALVKANGDVALERFFALEVQVLAARALGHTNAAEAGLSVMRHTFDGLSTNDQGVCRATLGQLGA